MISARIFHGWRIVAAGFVLETLMGALLFHAYGAYVVLLGQEFGWSKTLFSVAFAMARAESGILGPIQGWLTDRFGPRTLIRIGMTIFGLGFMLFSQIGSPLTFFLTFFLMARPAQSNWRMRGHMRSPAAWSAARIARSSAASTRPPSTTSRPFTHTRSTSSALAL